MSGLALGSLEGWALDPRYTHLNHGSFGAVTTRVAAARRDLLAKAEGRPVTWFAGLADQVARARPEVCALLGIPAGWGALTLNASAAASAIFGSLALRPGDEILATDHAYGAVLMGAQRWARAAGAAVTVAHIPLAAGDDEVVARIEAAATSRTRILLIDQVTSHTARLFPTARLAAALRPRGVLTVVDGSHGPGLIDDPFAASGGDLWFGNLHKWTCAPPSCGVIAGRPDATASLWPAIDSWGGDLPYPERFDCIGTADISAWLLASPAYGQLADELGWDDIRRHAEETVTAGTALIAAALEKATGQRLGVDVPTPAPAMRLVALPEPLGRTHAEVDSYRVPMSEQTGCECAFSNFGGRGFIRLSAHAYSHLDHYRTFAERGVPLLARWAKEGL
jgi:isopenicillin-N epimerase